MRYWLAKNLIVVPLLRLFFRYEVRGHENIPKKGAAIIASNHLAILDSAFVPGAMRRHVAFLAKEQFFAGKGFVPWVRRSFMGAMGQLEIDRGGGSASASSLGGGASVLRAGKLLGIYPEGTRSPDGRLYRGRTGIARMLLESGATVLPIAMIDTDKVLREGSIFPKLRRVGVVIGEPLDFSRFAGMENDRFVLRSITDEIMHELSKLSGQEYVDVYASSMKKSRPAAARRRGRR